MLLISYYHFLVIFSWLFLILINCKYLQGDLIKEGQVIGFLDQFGTELPVKVNSNNFHLLIIFFSSFLRSCLMLCVIDLLNSPMLPEKS